MALFFIAAFLQAAAYGLTFMLPRLFDCFGANEKVVGIMLFITTVATLITVYFAGHPTDRFGRVKMLGFGWGLTYSLASIVLTRLVSADQRVGFFFILSVAVMVGSACDALCLL